MALTTDEQAMRTALQELAAGQPEAPVDRVAGVRRRHVRRRTAQSIGAALGVAALLAGGLSVASAVRPTHGPSKVAASPALPWQLGWPERNDGTVDKQRVLLSLGQQGFDDLRDVRWLYAATAPGTISKWAILEADYAASPGDPRARAIIAAVSHDGGDHWKAQTHAVPPISTQVLGIADQGNAVLALVAPGVEAVELVKVQRADAIDGTSFPPLVNGASLITSSTKLTPGSTLVRAPGASSTFIVLFDNDRQVDTRPAWWNTAPVRELGDRPIGSSFGGGGGGFSNMHSPGIGKLVLQVRCVGPAPMLLHITAARSTQDLYVDQCDGLFHSYEGPQLVTGEKLGVYDNGYVDDHGNHGDNTTVIDLSLRP